jgi:murein DD-endopeptidase MepM/ murein hydrolase activator NlpD
MSQTGQRFAKASCFVALLQVLLTASAMALPQEASINKTAEGASQLRFAPTGGQLTSPFGWRSDPFTGQSRFHSGIDVATPEGSPVYAPQAGVVVFAGVHGGYGNAVVVHHGGKLFTLYGHNSKLLVVQGQTVDAGQPISLVGATGRATGPHLHFEVHNNNHYEDPKLYLLGIQNQWLAEGKLPGSVKQVASAATVKIVTTPPAKRHTTFRRWLEKRDVQEQNEVQKNNGSQTAETTKAPVPEGGVGGL